MFSNVERNRLSSLSFYVEGSLFLVSPITLITRKLTTVRLTHLSNSLI